METLVNFINSTPIFHWITLNVDQVFLWLVVIVAFIAIGQVLFRRNNSNETNE